jgi:hypothetical protein
MQIYVIRDRLYSSSHGLVSNSNIGAYTSDVSGQVTATGTDSLPDFHSANMKHKAIYVYDPNIRIGTDRLRIFMDQAVFVPIIFAY